MIQISIRVRRNALSENFGAFVTESQSIVLDLTRKAADRAVEIESTYPPEYSSDKPYPWVSERQRLFVLISIAKGLIKVPRPRTNEFRNSWSVEPYKSGFRIRSTYPPAMHVVGLPTQPERQAAIHRGRWTPLRTATETAIAELPQEAQENVILAARRRGL